MNRLIFSKSINLYLPITSLLFLIIILYFSILKDLVLDWWIDPNYSHGFFIPLVSGYLIWQRKEKLRRLPIVPCNLGLLVLLFGIFTLLVGTVGAELFTTRCSLLFVVAGLVLFNLGKDFFKHLAFPMAFLVFMIPLPYLVYDSIAFPLKLFAARFATLVLQSAGIPILREGNIITLATTTLEVADACSGIRSLISLLALGTIYAYITQNGLLKKVILVLSTIPIAIFANSSRLVVTGFIAHYYDPAVAEGFFHGFSGWLLFMLAFLMFLGVGMILQKIQWGTQ